MIPLHGQQGAPTFVRIGEGSWAGSSVVASGVPALVLRQRGNTEPSAT